MKLTAPVFAFAALLCFWVPSLPCYAVVFPAEGAVLNYRIVGFSFPVVPGATRYQVQISHGNIYNDKEFDPAITLPFSDQPIVIGEVPLFGASYTWRVVSFSGNKKVATGMLAHFSTGMVQFTDTAQARLRVTQNDRKDQFYILSDGTNVMYDTAGRPVWYLPPPKTPTTMACDLKVSPRHTLTYIMGRDAVEISYSGDILWESHAARAPHKNDPNISAITLHHEFFRLSNGHYIALGSEPLLPTAPMTRQNAEDSGKHHSNHHFFPGCLNGVLYEYDSSGSMVWSWRSTDYFTHSDLGKLYEDMEAMQTEPVTSHENAFYFDEQKQVIYLSYAAFNRIIEISYPSGKVISTYGALYDRRSGEDTLLRVPGMVRNALKDHIFRNGLFSGQHAVKETQDGSILLYNNNMFDTSAPAQLLMLRRTSPDRLEKVWEFNCPLGDQPKAAVNDGGGAVCEMPDGTIFASANFPYSKLFIVDRQKEVQWSALLEKKNGASPWAPFSSYRSSILTRAELEQMIWASETLTPQRPAPRPLPPDAPRSR